MPWDSIETVRRVGTDEFWSKVNPSHVANSPWMAYDDVWVDEVR